ncbi:DNA polymerase I, thermostable [Porphyridium purpureum]|uniref:DNA polymerase I, thermostable n=1 Tax=Porphyridium purpureum TaxID=35688 RepID=A0A5J4YXW9_PORPP|nr:DNA polymerase I, thermostable [Porphyridium purpureum]|eukprot:POR1958..scf209_3
MNAHALRRPPRCWTTRFRLRACTGYDRSVITMHVERATDRAVYMNRAREFASDLVQTTSTEAINVATGSVDVLVKAQDKTGVVHANNVLGPVFAPATGWFFIIDALNLVFRNYYALAGPMGDRLDASGDDTQAAFGVVNQLTKLLREEVKHAPLAVVFESTGSSLRRKMHPAYKGTRKKTPPGVRTALPYVEAIIKACGFPAFKVDGFEGDDVIVQLALNATRAGQKCVIVSGDKDFNQVLKQDSIHLLKLMNKGYQRYEEADFRREFGGLRPDQFVDLLALTGDAADSIPGVKGIGPKTAQKLLLEFETAEGIFDNIDKVKPVRTQKLLSAAGREQVALSKALVRFISEGLGDHPGAPFRWGDGQLRKEPDVIAMDDIFSRLRIGRKKLDPLCAILEQARQSTSTTPLEAPR